MDHIIKVIGNRVICMVEVYLFGVNQTKDMKEITISVRNKVTENTTTTLINGMKACGKTVSNMVKVQFTKTVKKYSQEDGNMV